MKAASLREREKNADIVNTTSINSERMMCFIQEPLDAESHNFPPGE
jgi:hypothetical protein